MSRYNARRNHGPNLLPRPRVLSDYVRRIIRDNDTPDKEFQLALKAIEMAADAWNGWKANITKFIDQIKAAREKK